MLVYAVVVAASIIFIGKPLDDGVSARGLIKLLIDWRFLFGGALALVARFVFVIINNLASAHPRLASAHLTVAALATTASLIFIILANSIFLGEQLRPIQMVGVVVVCAGIFLLFS